MTKSTVVAIITSFEDGIMKVLLARRNTEPYKNFWSLPGGHIEGFETVEAAVIREVKEEIGLDFEPHFFCYFDEIIPDKNIHAVVIIFEGQASGEVCLSKNEISEITWVFLSEAQSMTLAFLQNSVLDKYAAVCMPGKLRTEILAEYAALRDEILKRLETKRHLLISMLVVSGTLLTLGATNTIPVLVLLIHPVLAASLALAWAHSDMRSGEIGDYIRKNIESKLPGLGWETYLRPIMQSRKQRWLGWILVKASEFSASGVFLITQLLAVIIAWSRMALWDTELLMLFPDALALVLTVYFLHLRRRSY